MTSIVANLWPPLRQAMAGDGIEFDLVEGIPDFCGVVRAGIGDGPQQEIGGVARQQARVVRNLGLAFVILILGAVSLYEILDYRPGVFGRVVVGEEPRQQVCERTPGRRPNGRMAYAGGASLLVLPHTRIPFLGGMLYPAGAAQRNPTTPIARAGCAMSR